MYWSYKHGKQKKYLRKGSERKTADLRNWDRKKLEGSTLRSRQEVSSLHRERKKSFQKVIVSHQQMIQKRHPRKS